LGVKLCITTIDSFKFIGKEEANKELIPIEKVK
jgi:hypothetical protein